MNTYNKIRKNTKALSPVVASIILIAVTVAVSVVVAAWMGGMSIGLMGNAEQATITNLEIKATEIVATVQNTGSTSMTFTNGYVNGVAVGGNCTLVTLTKGQSGHIGLTYTQPASGTEITVKITTAKANNLVLTTIAP